MSLTAQPASSSDTTPTFAGTAGTASGDSSSVTVRVYSGSSVAGAQAADADGDAQLSGAYSVDAAALAPGTYTARAEQSDTAGNVGYSTRDDVQRRGRAGRDGARRLAHGAAVLIE